MYIIYIQPFKLSKINKTDYNCDMHKVELRDEYIYSRTQQNNKLYIDVGIYVVD